MSAMKSWKKRGRARKRLVPRSVRMSAMTPEEREKKKRRNERRGRTPEMIARKNRVLRIPGAPKEEGKRRRIGHGSR